MLTARALLDMLTTKAPLMEDFRSRAFGLRAQWTRTLEKAGRRTVQNDAPWRGASERAGPTLTHQRVGHPKVREREASGALATRPRCPRRRTTTPCASSRPGLANAETERSPGFARDDQIDRSAPHLRLHGFIGWAEPERSLGSAALPLGMTKLTAARLTGACMASSGGHSTGLGLPPWLSGRCRSSGHWRRTVSLPWCASALG